MSYFIVACASCLFGFLIAALFGGRRTDEPKDDGKYEGW